MKTKTAIMASLAWTGLLFVFGAIAIWYIVNNPVSGANLEERSSRAGSAVGTLGGIGFGLIWIPWAISARQRRLAPKRKKKSSRLET